MEFYKLLLIPAIFSSLIILSKSTSTPNPNNHLVTELQDLKLKISRLESILAESIEASAAKSVHLEEHEKLIEEMLHKIHHLESALFTFKEDSSAIEERISSLENEVQLLWAASRKNNFQLHNLESKSQAVEARFEGVNSHVEKMDNIVTEQWIQIQHLEQALQLAERTALRAQRQLGSTKCPFLKYVHICGDHLQKGIWMLDPYLFGKGSALTSFTSQAVHHLQRSWSAAKQYHHQLQSYIKQGFERNKFTASLANEELVFFVASAIIIFPMLSAWMWVSSQFPPAG